MVEGLLQTKLYIPPLRPTLVPRPRLIDQLNQGLELGHKLTLVSAPAGFGKTTLIAEWGMRMAESGAFRHSAPHADATRQPGRVRAIHNSKFGWLSLDENDSDPARFLAYLIAALGRVEGTDATTGRGALALLQSRQRLPAEDVLTSLINELAPIPGKIILVLDDYHLIESSPAEDAVGFLLEHLPPQMHLVICTREDPGLPIARIRAQDQLTELRATDLRFTVSEAAEFLTQVMGLSLSEEDVAALETRTEGWIAGLHLAAVSMQGREDTAGLIESFSGSHRHVMDYLVQEVLEQQPDGVRDFMLQTAILNRMTGSLCDAVRFGDGETRTGLDNGQATLEMLEHANLFVVRLDEERHWYRYHHLFADLLRHRLRQTQPEQGIRLHERASQWYEQNGFVDEATAHALRAEDFERAARLIEEQADAAWGRGENRKMQRWLSRLPEDVLFSRPNLAIFRARYQCNSGQLDMAEQTLEAVEQALNHDAGRASGAGPQMRISLTNSDVVKLRGRAAATRALISSYRGDVPGIIRQGSRALELLPPEDLTWRGVAAMTLGNAHGFQGDMTAAYQARFEALKACQAAGDAYFVLISNLQLAITSREQGQLQRTIDTCRRQWSGAVELGLSQSPAAGWLLAVWGETLAEIDDLNGAIERIRKGFELTERGADLQMFGWSFMCLIRALISSGDLATAEKTIQQMENLARNSQMPPWITGQMAAWQARLWLAQNKLEAASQWAEERGLDTGDEPMPLQKFDFFSLFDYLVLSRILIAQGRRDEATRLLNQLLKAARAGGRTSKVIEIEILLALSFQAGGQMDRALSRLKRALTLAEPEGFIRVFVDEGPPMASLLAEAASGGMASEYVSRLLAAFPSEESEKSDPAKAQSEIRDQQFALIEPLSDRELEVVQLIAEGLTNREIADRLYLSLNTVKVHTRNLYGKLGVHNRTQAVARSQELGILPNRKV